MKIRNEQSPAVCWWPAICNPRSEHRATHIRQVRMQCTPCPTQLAFHVSACVSFVMYSCNYSCYYFCCSWCARGIVSCTIAIGEFAWVGHMFSLVLLVVLVARPCGPLLLSQ